MPHDIRLAGPWEFLAAPDDWQRCKLPFPNSDASIGGAVSLRRRFNRPSGLEDGTRVHVVVSTDLEPPQLLLNDAAIPLFSHAEGNCSFEITAAMQQFNTLRLKTAATLDCDGVTNVLLRIVEANERPLDSDHSG